MNFHCKDTASGLRYLSSAASSDPIRLQTGEQSNVSMRWNVHCFACTSVCQMRIHTCDNAELLDEIYYDVILQQKHRPLEGEFFDQSTTTKEDARLVSHKRDSGTLDSAEVWRKNLQRTSEVVPQEDQRSIQVSRSTEKTQLQATSHQCREQLLQRARLCN